MPTILGEGVTPEDAIKYWKAKVLLSSDEAQKLSDNARSRAFYVSGLAQMDQVKAVHEALLSALENGETLADFKKNIAEVIQKQGWHSYRVENIFQTNMQTAYSAGRYAQMGKAIRTRPYWQYLSILDKRTRPNHAVLHRIVYPADHEFWSSFYPPNGFRCRCTVRALSERQVEKENISIQTKMPSALVYTDKKTGMQTFVHNPKPDTGFSGNVGKNWLGGLDMNKYPNLHKDSYKEQRNNELSIKTYEEMGDVIKTRLNSFATKNGLKNIIVDKNSSRFMSTNGIGNIWLSDHDFTQCKNFNPAQDLKEALNNCLQNKKLTWNQEYAFESLWHEITHNKQSHSRLKKGSTQLIMMETITQWTARRTYPIGMAVFGGKPSHQDDIIKNGLGYGQYVKNFDTILDILDINKEEFLLFTEELIAENNTEDYVFKVENQLSVMSKSGKRAIKRALVNLGKNPNKFKEAIDELSAKRKS